MTPGLETRDVMVVQIVCRAWPDIWSTHRLKDALTLCFFRGTRDIPKALGGCPHPSSEGRGHLQSDSQVSCSPSGAADTISLRTGMDLFDFVEFMPFLRSLEKSVALKVVICNI